VVGVVEVIMPLPLLLTTGVVVTITMGEAGTTMEVREAARAECGADVVVL